MQLAAVDLADPFRDVVEEVAVVRHRENCAGVRRQELLEPQHALGVEVVGRLVEQQQVGLGQQQLAQRDAAALTTRQVGDRRIAGRTAQRVHGLVDLRVEIPGVGVVEVLLELAHLLHEFVGVVGGEQLGDLVEAVELLLDLAHPLFDVLLDRLLLV
ncbi:30S ribosomal protein S5 [Mycobacteroides abscessus subsp. abscessus]|nr:30S ribosomal protein S5 [Mycobacteroides abscessus subsp. abscessus]